MTSPGHDAIQSALRKIVASRPFQGSERMSRFLSFVVKHALTDDGAPLKEHLIAQEVFDRSDSFDPRTDTIVRVEARRLRAKLKEYYAAEGQDDPVVIELAQRGYAPTFRVRLAPEAAPASPRKITIKLATAAVVAAAVISAAAVAVWRGTHATAAVESIVVLPFLNLSGNPDNDFFGEGLTEEISNALASFPQLRVVARTSAFQFKGRSEDVRRIGERLGVSNVLEGSVRKEGKRIRVTAQLVTVRDGMHLWSKTYDHELGSVLEIEQQITRSIVDALKIRLVAETSSRRQERSNAEAHELYLKGRYFWYKGTPPDVKKSIEYMERAIAQDPEYAAAYAGLADALSLWSGFDLEPPNQVRPKMKAAAQTAVKLDDRSGEGHFAFGIVLANEWDWAGAEREFRRSIDLKPSTIANRQAYAVLCLAPQRRYEEAIAQMRQVVAYDPVSVMARTILGQTFAYASQPDVAIREINHALELEPGFVFAKLALVQAYLDKTWYPKALELLTATRDEAGEIFYHTGLLGYTHARMGNRAEAESILRRLLARSWPPPVDIAGIYSGLGELEPAFQWLDRAYEHGSTWYVRDDPRFRSLHSDPRFARLLKQMRLAP